MYFKELRECPCNKRENKYLREGEFVAERQWKRQDETQLRYY